MDNRKLRGKIQYKVHWDGYNTDEETWENESQLNCNELIDEYLNDKNKIDNIENSEEKEEDVKENETVEAKGNKRKAKGIKKGSSSKRQKTESVNGQEQGEYEVNFKLAVLFYLLI